MDYVFLGFGLLGVLMLTVWITGTLPNGARPGRGPAPALPVRQH